MTSREPNFMALLAHQASPCKKHRCKNVRFEVSMRKTASGRDCAYDPSQKADHRGEDSGPRSEKVTRRFTVVTRCGALPSCRPKFDDISVCSDISRASSTSIPK